MADPDKTATKSSTKPIRNRLRKRSVVVIGDNVFNYAMIFVMILKLSTYFILVPDLPDLMSYFDVSHHAVAQILTFYKLGKLIGAVVISLYAYRFNLLKYVYVCMSLYIVVIVIK